MITIAVHAHLCNCCVVQVSEWPNVSLGVLLARNYIEECCAGHCVRVCFRVPFAITRYQLFRRQNEMKYWQAQICTMRRGPPILSNNVRHQANRQKLVSQAIVLSCRGCCVLLSRVVIYTSTILLHSYVCIVCCPVMPLSWWCHKKCANKITLATQLTSSCSCSTFFGSATKPKWILDAALW